MNSPILKPSSVLTPQAKLGICCPHCKGPARIRSSRALSSTYRQLTVACLKPECGHTFGSELAITHTISPSAMPDPTVVLRIAPPRRRPANDAVPLPANDDEPASSEDDAGDACPAIEAG